MQVAQTQASEREKALIEEKGMLKTALTQALGKQEALEGQVTGLQREHNALSHENTNLKHQVCYA